MGRVAWLTAACVGLFSIAFPSVVAAQGGEEPSEETPSPRTEGESGSETTDGEVADETSDAEPADPSDARARELYVEGDRLYAEGRYEEAVVAFDESYALSGRPLLLFNLANAYERLGSYEDAADALTRYIAHAEEAERPTLQRRIDALRERAEQGREEERERERAERERRQPVPVEPPDDTLAWALIASGGVVALSSIVLGGLSLAANADAQSLCVEAGGQTLCPRGAQSSLGRASALGLAADITAGVGLATLAVGAVLLIVNHTRRGSSVHAAAAPGGATLKVAF